MKCEICGWSNGCDPYVHAMDERVAKLEARQTRDWTEQPDGMPVDDAKLEAAQNLAAAVLKSGPRESESRPPEDESGRTAAAVIPPAIPDGFALAPGHVAAWLRKKSDERKADFDGHSDEYIEGAGYALRMAARLIEAGALVPLVPAAAPETAWHDEAIRLLRLAAEMLAEAPEDPDGYFEWCDAYARAVPPLVPAEPSGTRGDAFWECVHGDPEERPCDGCMFKHQPAPSEPAEAPLSDDERKPLSDRIYGLCNLLPKAWLERGCDMAEEVRDLEEDLADMKRDRDKGWACAAEWNRRHDELTAKLAAAEKERQDWRKCALAAEEERDEARRQVAEWVSMAGERTAQVDARVAEERTRCLVHFDRLGRETKFRDDVREAIASGAPAPKVTP